MGTAIITQDLMAATLPVGVRRLPGIAQVTTQAPLESLLVSPLLLPETRLNVEQSELVDDTILASDWKATSTMCSCPWSQRIT